MEYLIPIIAFSFLQAFIQYALYLFFVPKHRRQEFADLVSKTWLGKWITYLLDKAGTK